MIDLGNKYEPPCAPKETECKDEPKITYPTFYFSCAEKCELPENGTATIKFRKVEDAENTRDPDDPRYRYELEVHGIEVTGEDEPEEKKSKKEDPVESLSSAMKDLGRKKE